MLDRVRTILVHNTHPGNLGAVARALKNMGLSQLWLVSPRHFPSQEASARAKDAVDLLEKAVVVPTLAEALSGCELIFGTSARARTLTWPLFSARQVAEQIHQFLSTESYQISDKNSTVETKTHRDKGSEELIHKPPTVAIVYGCEQHGLTNEQLHLCQAQIFIPANPEYTSLNLAQAVQIISYELRMTLSADNLKETILKEKNAFETKKEDLPSHEAIAGFYTHFEEVLVQVGHLNPNVPGQLMPRLKRLFDRAAPDKIELNILRGILKSIQQAFFSRTS